MKNNMESWEILIKTKHAKVDFAWILVINAYIREKMELKSETYCVKTAKLRRFVWQLRLFKFN